MTNSAPVQNPNVTYSTDRSGNVTLVGSNGNNIALNNNGGPVTVLFGDSMTTLYNPTITPTSWTYNSTTGVLTVTETGSNLTVTDGAWVHVWSTIGYYPSIAQFRRLQLTIKSATTWSVTFPDIPQDIAASGTTQIAFLHENRRANNSFVNWFQMRNGWPLNIVANNALPGADSTLLLSMVQQYCCALSPQLVIMQNPGVNDNGGGHTPTPTNTTIANLTSIYNQILATGAYLVVFTTTPVASGEFRATAADMGRIQLINRWLKKFAQAHQRMRVQDAWAYVVNPIDTAGLAQTAYVNTTDKIHYTGDAAYYINRYLLEQELLKIFPYSPRTNSMSRLDSYRQNALTSPTGASISGVVTITATHAYLVGDEIRVTGATPAAANGVFIVTSISTTVSFTYYSAGMIGQDGALTGTLIVGMGRNVFPYPVLYNNTNAGNITTANGINNGGTAGLIFASLAVGGTGNFTCTATAYTLYVGMQVIVTNVGSFTGIATTTYVISVTNGSTSFTLTTLAGVALSTGGTMGAAVFTASGATYGMWVQNGGAQSVFAAVAYTANAPVDSVTGNSYGNEQVVVVSQASSTEFAQIKLQNSTGANSFYADLFAGRVYVAECQLRLGVATSWANVPLSKINFSLQIGTTTPFSITSIITGIEPDDAPTNAISVNFSNSGFETLTLRTPPMTIPVSMTVSSSQLVWQIEHKAGITNSDTLTIGISRIAIWDVTGDPSISL